MNSKYLISITRIFHSATSKTVYLKKCGVINFCLCVYIPNLTFTKL